MSKKELIIGKNSVKEAIQGTRKVYKVYVNKELHPKSRNELVNSAKKSNITLQQLSREEFEQKVPSGEHQGVAAEVEPFKYHTLEEVLDNAEKKNKAPFLLILDHLTDPQNLGAILRTADAVAVDGVIIPKRRSVDITPNVIKASSGASEYVPVIKVSNLRQVVSKLKEKWIWVVGADMDGDTVYYESDLKGPLALVMGSEGFGISEKLKNDCDFLVNIPMVGNVNSLNVSVATALLLYERFRQEG
ncbi:23S rRNA (guanosine(2251)-2'-O)-methyltransferase RlmB [Natranaerobius trueperi]|uniref:23S rRNA (Guanosine(2251)-2'-O)-methyltransferase RlmB n=1 Tax=Natranaerobius trueperi TaxID=759412 RepID=A0A226BZM7_9FIRM|nr:23S rRNA (guanosine(2251)-2'-O)-methyltransferase RlmB [Natranaerobius trueperi]OWZ84508.1 23S rRNA (guanosine(2251)-2'-O)-methyltransferase RlmB [Natranaerobius trueperi]